MPAEQSGAREHAPDNKFNKPLRAETPSEQIDFDFELSPEKSEKTDFSDHEKAQFLRIAQGDLEEMTRLNKINDKTAQLLSSGPGMSEEIFLTPADLGKVKDHWDAVKAQQAIERPELALADDRENEAAQEYPKRILDFQNLEELADPKIAHQLTKFNGTLYFGAIKSLDNDVLKELCAHRGPLFMPVLENVDAAGLAILAARPFDTQLSYKLKEKIRQFKQSIKRSP